ncbi:hypothetical protein HDA32_002495 [Spinactinospora alkalitolerans]|uniref:Uncharacterized protein n=1 Tax=Spinactinospora alkalitolerans TaxID=687207 RepID=A0A852TVF2_9ACTN|nr:hypothetical protein [Spinactinospora alkalitolerans]
MAAAPGEPEPPTRTATASGGRPAGRRARERKAEEFAWSRTFRPAGRLSGSLVPAAEEASAVRGFCGRVPGGTFPPGRRPRRTLPDDHEGPMWRSRRSRSPPRPPTGGSARRGPDLHPCLMHKVRYASFVDDCGECRILRPGSALRIPAAAFLRGRTGRPPPVPAAPRPTGSPPRRRVSAGGEDGPARDVAPLSPARCAAAASASRCGAAGGIVVAVLPIGAVSVPVGPLGARCTGGRCSPAPLPCGFAAAPPSAGGGAVARAGRPGVMGRASRAMR